MWRRRPPADPWGNIWEKFKVMLTDLRGELRSPVERTQVAPTFRHQRIAWKYETQTDAQRKPVRFGEEQR